MNKTNPGLRTSAYVILGVGSFIMLVPFLYMLSTSLTAAGSELTLPPKLIPEPFVWHNYTQVWIEVNFLQYTMNSIFVTLMDLIGTVASCAIVAYGLAFFQFRGRNMIFLSMLGTMMLPSQITMIPTYFIWKSVGALDTYYPLIVRSFLGGAFGIFLLHQFYKTLPKELYDAAWVDGANPWKIFYKIYLPLAKPALSALAVFTFMSAWNNTLEPLIYLQDKHMFTLPLGLLFLKNEVQNRMTLVMAGAVITIVPVLFVFLFAQKYFVQGIASTGLKG
ncbi:carbohydrate ABC transporter permease [Paenibacillus qinlingensis]|uniref:Multiple sugar transport system permease protein n=1 Tax=Paenibacillus qinlingensis TaxID=1837343 RepID=A0ABU1NS92_9BACL|nr:carbohydrate ABC transporter permease [Paenibacillus qinlingensis]MDR6550298.1 multiple sugar transport system permease protein [Paenibacillus qinlingensis]